MHRRKGFTLIELLAVIVIVAIISLIVTPLILNLIENVNKNAFKDSIYGIMESVDIGYSKTSLSDNKIEYTEYSIDDGKISLTKGNVEIKYKGKNPDYGKIGIMENGDKAFYLYDDGYCITKQYDEEDFSTNKVATKDDCKIRLTPINYKIIGDNPTYIEAGSEYVDQGIQVDGTNDITVTYEKDGQIIENIDTSSIGEYNVVYSFNLDGEEFTKKRMVIINDTTSPELIVPEQTTLYTTDVENYDLLNGISATDNSNDVLNIEVVGNISAIVGEYNVTYRVSDSSGNIAEKTRIFIINAPAYLASVAKQGDYVYYPGSKVQNYRVLSIKGTGTSAYVKIMSDQYIATSVSDESKTITTAQSKLTDQLVSSLASSILLPSIVDLKEINPNYVACSTSYACKISTTKYVGGITNGKVFWLSTTYDYNRTWTYVENGTQYATGLEKTIPASVNVVGVVTLRTNVVVKSGTGTAADPYYLATI